jgi:hypothetical protein
LALFHPALQARRRHEIAPGGDDEAAHLDEERGRFGVAQGLFEEGDGGVIGEVMLLKQGQGRLSLVIRDGRVSARFEEKMDEEGG